MEGPGDLGTAAGLCVRLTETLLPTPGERTFPPTVLPTHCLSPLHSSRMLAGTLPRQPERQRVAILQSPSGTCEGCRERPPCLRVLHTPCSRAPRESRRPLRTTDGLEGKWGVMADSCACFRGAKPQVFTMEARDTLWCGETEAQSGYGARPSQHVAILAGSRAAGPEPSVSPPSRAASGA